MGNFLHAEIPIHLRFALQSFNILSWLAADLGLCCPFFRCLEPQCQHSEPHVLIPRKMNAHRKYHNRPMETNLKRRSTCSWTKKTKHNKIPVLCYSGCWSVQICSFQMLNFIVTLDSTSENYTDANLNGILTTHKLHLSPQGCHGHRLSRKLSRLIIILLFSLCSCWSIWMTSSSKLESAPAEDCWTLSHFQWTTLLFYKQHKKMDALK